MIYLQTRKKIISNIFVTLFIKTHNRKQLRNEIDNMANRLVSASTGVLSSASSVSCNSDGIFQNKNKLNGQIFKNSRPKSASVQNLRKRNTKKVLNKCVKNDINEDDIMDKMQMVQQAINSHRESIQQLLQTTAHSPNSLSKPKYSTSIQSMEDSEKPMENNESDKNQYKKMPNVTARRVVFVNLDEDS